MQRTVDQSLEDVDAVLLVLSARERIGAGDRYIAERVFALGVPVVIALNKVDRLKPGHIAEQMQNGARLGEFHVAPPRQRDHRRRDRRAPRRARRAAARGAARTTRATSAPTSRPRLQVAELIREKALQLTREEVPHAISVEVDELAEKVVRATIFVETESQKQIVVGKGGSIVKKIGTRARPEIEQLLGHPVFLELKVKARPRWRRDEAMLERLGHLMPLLVLFDVDGTLFLTDDPLARPAPCARR